MLPDADLLDCVTFLLKFLQCPSLTATNSVSFMVKLCRKAIFWSLMVCGYNHGSMIWRHLSGLVVVPVLWVYATLPCYSCKDKVIGWCLLRLHPGHWSCLTGFILHLDVMWHFFFTKCYLLSPYSKIVPSSMLPSSYLAVLYWVNWETYWLMKINKDQHHWKDLSTFPRRFCEHIY